MRIFVEDEVIEEINIEIESSEDRGVVITDQRGQRGLEVDETTKIIAGIDAINTTARESAIIHNQTLRGVGFYRNGENMSEDARATVMSAKHQIHDTAVAKLMDTLNLFNPDALEKPKDIIDAASKLSSVVERLGNKEKSNGDLVVHFHMPNQRKLESYGEVIDA